MAHFAKVEDGVVTQVVVVANAAIDGGTFPDSEPLGQALLAEAGLPGTWVQCSYSGAFRGAYPGQGWSWNGSTFTAPEA